MKKVMFLFMVCVLFLTGCGKSSKNQVVCTGTVEESGYKVSMKVVADFKDDKITNASAEMTFDDESTAQSFCGVFALVNQMAENESDKIPYECKGKTLKITDFSKFEAMESEEEESSIIGKSKADFIKAMEDENMSCK